MKDAKKLADEFTTTWARALNHSSFMAAIREHPSIASDFGRMVDKIAALESHNSSALKELRKKVEAKSKTLEEVGVDLNPLSLDMRRMVLEHYDWFISEIDSLINEAKGMRTK